MPVLDISGKQGVKLSVRSFPKPAEVPAWKSFRAQLLSVGDDGPAVAWESNSYPKPTGRNQKFSRTIKAMEFAGLEEGTYFLKVDAYDQNGALLTEPRPVDPAKPDGRAENESDFFLVTNGVDPGEIELPTPRVTRVPSALDAYFLMAGRQRTADEEEAPSYDTIVGAWNEPIAASLKADVFFELQGPWEAYAVVMPSVFRRLELDILRHPELLGQLRLDCNDVRETSDIRVERRDAVALPDWEEAKEFLAARTAAFAAIRQQHITRSGQPDSEPNRAGVVETADLVSVAGEIARYATAYRAVADKLLASETIQPGALKALAPVDVVEVLWRRGPGDPGRALVLSPTHPLRLLWHLQHAQLCLRALTSIQQGQNVSAPAEFLRQLRSNIAASSLPLVLYDSRGRGYVDHGGLTPYWSVYLPEGTNGDRAFDVSACRDRVRHLLGIRFTRAWWDWQ